MTNDERDIQRKLRVLQHAEKIGNARKACRYFGVGRSSFYRWRDAYQKHGEAGCFDVVLANFGVMFFANNEEAFANIRRAIKNNGRFAATVWGMPSDNPWFSMPQRIVDQFVENVPQPDPTGPSPMRFGDVSKLEEHLRASGWKPSTQTLDVELLPPGSPERVAELHMKVTAGMNLSGIDTTENQLAAIKNVITEACQDLERDGQVIFPARIHVVTAQAI